MLTPIEIQDKEFKRGLRGYREGEVQAFLGQVFEGYQKLYQENQEMRDQIFRLEQDLKRYQEWETTLKDTLILAQKAAEETKENAQRDSELTLREAQLRAEKVIEDARVRVEEFQGQYENLERQAAVFRRRWKALLEAELASLDSLEGASTIDSFTGASAAAGQEE